ncbi:MAG: peptidoglycan DD-metalloendopeptidase family protein, partial [Paraglaciecola sp.]|nr:peptidoglycan DD-metalloendopeptidase family protein [Paraglaciecola sp.]
ALRAGDSFYVLYEEHFIDGEYIENGDIVAAQFVNQGETYTAIRHSDGNFYTPDGRSLRKSFLRAPVNFKYISSNFNPNRFHPIQKRYKPHNGIDYRAAKGTPVVAAGDGKVIEAGYNRFNGNYVFIQHGENYTTKYLHFSKSAVKNGAKVKQGQVIGYVGATGMAEAPHLHYEFLVDGVHRNPRTVALPKAQPIDKAEAKAFASISAQRLTQLNNNKRIMLAMN